MQFCEIQRLLQQFSGNFRKIVAEFRRKHTCTQWNMRRVYNDVICVHIKWENVEMSIEHLKVCGDEYWACERMWRWACERIWSVECGDEHWACEGMWSVEMSIKHLRDCGGWRWALSMWEYVECGDEHWACERMWRCALSMWENAEMSIEHVRECRDEYWTCGRKWRWALSMCENVECRDERWACERMCSVDMSM